MEVTRVLQTLELAARATASDATAHPGAASPTSTSTSTPTAVPSSYKAIGITLAVCSGLFIGSSFVLKKTGLLRANAKYNEEAGEGYGYLKNAYWWSGMTLMIIGELCNFAAYAFVDAILVAPMGALSVVITAILSAIFLKERLSFVGQVGCFQCIVGSVIIAANSPQQQSASTIQEMKSYVLSPGFLSYAGVIIVGCAVIAIWAGPRYGKKSMLVYLTVCSLIGGLSVVATQGLGAAIVTQARGTPQFNQWFLYILLAFVITTLLTEIIYLNKALNLFNAALVTPTYYVYFTSATIVTSAILFRGFKGTAIQILTIVLGFLVICSGVVLLQLSKSAKDVPDTAIFSGDLDQVRTIAEQEEHESEPKADAIRGSAALLRTMSKTRLRREASEARRIKEEMLEPIGENEQVEWDGLRRRKTVLKPGESLRVRPKTMHPPLGMTHFPTAEEEAEQAEGDLLPAFRKRAATVIHRARSVTSNSTDSSMQKQPHKSYTVPLSDIATQQIGALPGYPAGKRTDPLSSMRAVSGASFKSNDSTDGDLSAAHPQVYGLPDDLKRSNSLGLSGMHEQETAYPSSTHGGPSVHFSPDVNTRPQHLAPTPPPHSNNKRQFSISNVFRRSHDGAADASPRPQSSRSSIFGRHRSSQYPHETEEERLGLVQGDPTSSTHSSPVKTRTGPTIIATSPNGNPMSLPEIHGSGAHSLGFEKDSNDSGDSSDEHEYLEHVSSASKLVSGSGGRSRRRIADDGGAYSDVEGHGGDEEDADEDESIINAYTARSPRNGWHGHSWGGPDGTGAGGGGAGGAPAFV